MSTPGDNLPALPALAAGEVLRLQLDVAGLYAMRAAVAAHASRFGLTGHKLSNMLVVATELAANCIRHGGGTGELRLWRDGDAVRCQVSDNGPGIADPDQAGTQLVPLASDGGRGLWLSRLFTDELAIINNHPGTTITATITI